MWANYHTHTSFCDGTDQIQEIIQQAADRLYSLGFSSHAPLPFSRPWCMSPERLGSYLEDLASAKKSALNIYAGLEIDFIPRLVGPNDFQNKLDYTIGSIHFVDFFEDGEGWEIDGTHALFQDGLNRIFKGNAKAAVERYFELTREMVTQSSPTIVGHLDKIKIQSVNGQFSESQGWYRQAVLATLDVIQRSDSIVEVNTRGLYQKKADSTYPSPWVLEEVLKRKIPVTLSSDAHHPKDLTNQFEETAHILLGVGFKNLRILVEGRWQDVPFNEHGLQFKKISYHPMA